MASAAYMAFSHGNNDAQKTMGIIKITHIISSTIMGVGSSRRLTAVRWSVGGNIILAWVFTIPACLGLSWGIAKLLHML